MAFRDEVSYGLSDPLSPLSEWHLTMLVILDLFQLPEHAKLTSALETLYSIYLWLECSSPRCSEV